MESRERRRLTLAVDDDLWDWLEFASTVRRLTGRRKGMTAYINAAIRRDKERADAETRELYDSWSVLNGDGGDGA